MGDQVENLDRFIAALPRPILHATADSRLVTPGSVFVAVRGGAIDGHGFIPQAVANGAVAVVGERPDLAAPVPALVVPSSRSALAYLSAYVHGFPSRRLVMVGVTGTDGKTTTVNLVYQMLKAAGVRAGMVSTVNAVMGGQVQETGLHVTTPDAPVVQRLLAEMVELGLTHCVLEATSHGLAQARVAFCDFDVAVITNVTHEHLDFHGDEAAYRAAKSILFQELAAGARKPGQAKTAVLNADDRSFENLSRIPAERRISYSVSETQPHRPVDLSAHRVHCTPYGTTFDLETGGKTYPVRTSLIGQANVSNLLAAAGAALALGVTPDCIQDGAAALTDIPGRMERIDLGQPFSVVVDFAHTPNALQRLIEVGRRVLVSNGRVITVFGSAGLRDAAKRRMMAQISARFADLTVLTAEDPRTEPLEGILAEMAAGCASEGAVEGLTFFRIADRMRAIHHAYTLARPRDIVLICGKGHEQSMCFGAIEYPWDDRAAARRALVALLEHRPPPDSGLPTGG